MSKTLFVDVRSDPHLRTCLLRNEVIQVAKHMTPWEEATFGVGMREMLAEGEGGTAGSAGLLWCLAM